MWFPDLVGFLYAYSSSSTVGVCVEDFFTVFKFSKILQNSKPCDWVLHKPPLRLSYGTHHSKAMLLVYPTGVRVIVHTANLIHVDWNNKSQGLWMQDFPWKTDACKGKKSSVFENDLVEYLTALEVKCKILQKKSLIIRLQKLWVG